LLWGKGQDLTPKALDYAGWAAAGFVNESWQGIQFASKSATTASLAYSLFNNSPSHSLIGENTLFGTPGTFGGAVATDVGQVFSYFAGIEGLAVLGLKGAKYLGKTDEVPEFKSSLKGKMGSGLAPCPVRSVCLL
jgi:hypothetical protein